MSMKQTSLWLMAWRNLGRNRRRTVLTLASIAFGVFLAIFSMASQDRNWQDMIDLGARMGGGHVTLQHPEYLDTPSLSRTVTGTDALIEAASGDPEVDRAVERLSGQLMVSTARESYGASFIAFDPEAEDLNTISYLEAVSEGEMFAADDPTGMVLGAQLAQNLGAELGDRVVYTATDRSGEIVAGLGRVRGILRTGAPSIDVGMVLLPIEAARGVLGFASDEATQVAIFVTDHRRSEALAARLQEQVGDEVAAVPWFEGRPDLYAFIAMKVGGGVIMIGIIALMVAAGIFNTVFISVMERLREFGIMMAVGFSPAKLFRLVVYESVWLGVIGLVLAGMLTIGPYLYLSRFGIDMGAMLGNSPTEISGVAMATQLKFGIYPENAVRIVALAFAAVVLAGIYPAWRAGRVRPVESIRIG